MKIFKCKDGIIIDLPVISETKDKIKVIEDSWVTTLNKSSLPLITGNSFTRRIYGTSKEEIRELYLNHLNDEISTTEDYIKKLNSHKKLIETLI